MSEPNTEHPLVGRRIVAVDRLTDEELDDLDWYRDGGEVMLVLDDDTVLFAQSDSEGNGMGAMMHVVGEDLRLVLVDREV